MTGWNLPPGCTDKDIDDAFGDEPLPPLRCYICGTPHASDETRCANCGAHFEEEMTMTDDDLDFLTDLKDRFWREFSDLANRYIEEARQRDPALIDYATMMLGESTSIYGRRI